MIIGHLALRLAGFRNHYWPVSLLITLSFWVSIILWAVYKDKVVAYFIIMIIIYLLDTIFQQSNEKSIGTANTTV